MRTLIRYRTTDCKHSMHVIVPSIFVLDMIGWLSDHECAEIIGHEQTDHPCLVPQHYPDYQACVDYIRTSDLIRKDR